MNIELKQIVIREIANGYTDNQENGVKAACLLP